MPNITLRLTDEQHAQLKQEAQDERRSMQQEVLHRLFVEIPAMAIVHDGAMHGGLPSDDPYLEKVREEVVLLGGDPEDVDEDAHFKPDPKPGKRK